MGIKTFNNTIIMITDSQPSQGFKIGECYQFVLSTVSQITEIEQDRILKSNCEECVDARHICIAVLSEKGFSDTKIANLTGLTRACVCSARNNFRYRLGRGFVRRHYNAVCSACKEL